MPRPRSCIVQCFTKDSKFTSLTRISFGFGISTKRFVQITFASDHATGAGVSKPR
jgi:hypothetical protein